MLLCILIHLVSYFHWRGECETLTNTNIKIVPRTKFKQEIDDSVIDGWKLERYNKDVAILSKKGGYGAFMTHVVIFLFTAWFTVFFGNFIYVLYSKYINRDELKIKATE